jgi:HTH-type transcriptional regulator/antitoxin HigA
MQGIRTKREYQEILREIESLMPAELGTPEGERLSALVSLVEAYEREHFPLMEPGEAAASQRVT